MFILIRASLLTEHVKKTVIQRNNFILSNGSLLETMYLRTSISLSRLIAMQWDLHVFTLLVEQKQQDFIHCTLEACRWRKVTRSFQWQETAFFII